MPTYKKLVVEKQATTATDTYDDYTDDEYYTDTEDESNYTSTMTTTKDKKIINIPIKSSKTNTRLNVNIRQTPKISNKKQVLVNQNTTKRDVTKNTSSSRNTSALKNPKQQNDYTQYTGKRMVWTRDEILKRLKDYIPLKTTADKALLCEYPILRTYIKYFNIQKKQFRPGGLLVKVAYPDYIVLKNSVNNIYWSVQLRDNVIYVPHPELFAQRQEQKLRQRVERRVVKQQQQSLQRAEQRRLETPEQREERQRLAQLRKREALVKNKLFEMYKAGRLAVK